MHPLPAPDAPDAAGHAARRHTVEFLLPDAAATTALAGWIAPHLSAGDTLLLEGPVGAGKSHFARALIRARQHAAGRAPEDVPSPTFTLVQYYDAGDVEIWHADLYRLTHPDEAFELGLEEAFGTAICLVEWPDRLGADRPEGALTLTLSPLPDTNARRARLHASAPRWGGLLHAAQQRFADPRHD